MKYILIFSQILLQINAMIFRQKINKCDNILVLLIGDLWKLRPRILE